MDQIAADEDRSGSAEGELKTKKKPAAAAVGACGKNLARQQSSANGRRARSNERSQGGRGKATQGDPTPDIVAGVRLTHPDKMLYPGQGLTKLDLAHYYQQVSQWMLPHVVGRPLTLVRCPAGQGKPCFFQKHPGEGAQNIWPQVNVSLIGEPEYNLAIKNVASLIELVQMGVLEIHVWGSLAKRFEKPDRLIFDLDPDPSVQWPQVVTAAREVRMVLEELESGVVSQNDWRQGTARCGSDPAHERLGTRPRRFARRWPISIVRAARPLHRHDE